MHHLTYTPTLGRWRVLKLPMLFQTQERVNNVIQTCVTLHNMLHDLDCRHVWESGLEWGGKDGHFDDQGRHWGLPKVHGVQVKPGDDFSRFGKLAFSRYIHQIRGPVPTSDGDLRRIVELECETSPAFFKLQRQLVTHFNLADETGDIPWLRS